MACGESSEISITSSDNTSSQTKSDSEYPPPVQNQILSAISKIRKSKNRADVKATTKKSIKPVAQVLMKTALRSIYLNY